MTPLTESQQFILEQIPHYPATIPANDLRGLDGRPMYYLHRDMRVLVRRGLVRRLVKFNALVSRMTPIVVPSC